MMEKALIEAITWARTKPEEVCERLEERRRNYKGNEYFPPNRDGCPVVTKEGVVAVEEARLLMSKDSDPYPELDFAQKRDLRWPLRIISPM